MGKDLENVEIDSSKGYLINSVKSKKTQKYKSRTILQKQHKSTQRDKKSRMVDLSDVNEGLDLYHKTIEAGEEEQKEPPM